MSPPWTIGFAHFSGIIRKWYPETGTREPGMGAGATSEVVAELHQVEVRFPFAPFYLHPHPIYRKLIISGKSLGLFLQHTDENGINPPKFHQQLFK
jgi:hypothetical protein